MTLSAVNLRELIDDYERVAMLPDPGEIGRHNPNAIHLHNLLELASDYRLDDLVELIDPKIDELVIIVRAALRSAEGS